MVQPLRVAISSYGHLTALKDGSVSVPQAKLNFIDFDNMVEAYRRMVRNIEFDICEMAPTTYLMARMTGAPYIALPIFLMRRLHHAGLLIRPGAGITSPLDLEGKRVGVRAYSVTSAVWTRGVLMDEYGLDPSKVTWVTVDEEHVDSITLPPNVERAPKGQTLAAMIAQDRLDAVFGGVPGIGQMGSKESGFAQIGQAVQQSYPELIANAPVLEADWYRRTGIYPLHGLIVVKDDLLAAHPDLGKSLFTAFVESKSRYIEALRSGAACSEEDQRYRQLSEIVGDPLPYGIDVNQPAIEALIGYSFQQRLIPTRPSIGDIFIDPAA